MGKTRNRPTPISAQWVAMKSNTAWPRANIPKPTVRATRDLDFAAA